MNNLFVREGESMLEQHDNIILFPGWKENLEKESLIALQEKRFEEALEKLNVLLDYQTDNHEIIIGKLMCLTELGRYDEAVDLSEELLTEKNEYYYDYAQIYLTVLFQTSQYTALIDRVTYELEDPMIPTAIAEQFQQLYDLSKEMNKDVLDKQVSVYTEALTKAIREHNYERQWQMIENLRKMKIEPTNEIISYLTKDFIHPVIKTSIFKWLKDLDVTEEVEIHKLNISAIVKPIDVASIRTNVIINEILSTLNDLEQDNPSLYILLEQLLYRYAYVKFPMLPKGSDVTIVAEALRNIGAEYLHESSEETIDDSVSKYIEDIKMCEALYLSVIAE